MIALCSNHAAKADGGYYPEDHLLRLKREGRNRADAISGKFDYLRNDILTIIGGNAFLRTPTPLKVGDRRCTYFNRDADGYLLLNIKIPQADGGLRTVLADNVWTVPATAAAIACPPQGRFLEVKFDNDDMFRVEFRDYDDLGSLAKAHPGFLWDFAGPHISFPITVASFWERAAGSRIEFTPGETRIGSNVMSGGLTVDCAVGLHVSAFDPRSADCMGLDKATAQLLRDQLNTWHRRRRPWPPG